MGFYKIFDLKKRQSRKGKSPKKSILSIIKFLQDYRLYENDSYNAH